MHAEQRNTQIQSSALPYPSLRTRSGLGWTQTDVRQKEASLSHPLLMILYCIRYYMISPRIDSALMEKLTHDG